MMVTATAVLQSKPPAFGNSRPEFETLLKAIVSIESGLVVLLNFSRCW
jgi:hypothetical protein